MKIERREEGCTSKTFEKRRKEEERKKRKQQRLKQFDSIRSRLAKGEKPDPGSLGLLNDDLEVELGNHSGSTSAFPGEKASENNNCTVTNVEQVDAVPLACFHGAPDIVSASGFHSIASNTYSFAKLIDFLCNKAGMNMGSAKHILAKCCASY